MDKVLTELSKDIFVSNDQKVRVKVGHIFAFGVGALGLYMLVPERKRKSLFK